MSSSLIFGFSPKHLSLAILTVQNTALGVVMHHSMVSVPAGKHYFFPTAVLLAEILKCLSSIAIALCTIQTPEAMTLPLSNNSTQQQQPDDSDRSKCCKYKQQHAPLYERFRFFLRQVASSDCWKLAIPAVLYVLQNNLQFVAVSNLEPPVFICAYQIKILTTAFFSILLLNKRLGSWQWISLAMLAVGVAIVQIQSKSVSGLVPFHVDTHGYGHISAGPVANIPPPAPPPPFDSHRAPPPDRLSPIDSFLQHSPFEKTFDHLPPSSPSFAGARISMSMEESAHAGSSTEYNNSVKGFLAVIAACFTSGLAGVYFELVLKTSSTNLWTRNVQLSIWSILPAAIPVVLDIIANGWLAPFRFFGISAWATVLLQVTGGLAVALVIQHADNILKGFAVSFSIFLSFAISVIFTNFPFNGGLVVGGLLVMLSTFTYSRPTFFRTVQGSFFKPHSFFLETNTPTGTPKFSSCEKLSPSSS